MKKIVTWSLMGIIALGATGCTTDYQTGNWGFNPPGGATVSEVETKPHIEIEPVAQTSQKISERQRALDAAYLMLNESNAQGYGYSKADMYSGLRHHDWFTHDAAQYAVDTMSVNWNNQAVLSAKSYLSLGIEGGVTRAELVDYLVNGFRYTTAQANYAADQLKSQLRSVTSTPTPSASSIPANPSGTTTVPDQIPEPESIPTYY